MRKQLQIGEVAQLLGVTTKTIRHYQKIGLLHEPERTSTGYRLFDAQDLLRLKDIRRLQSFGLSLKQIKAVLGEPARERSLRDVLQALDQELCSQIQTLEERRQVIRQLLDREDFETLEQLPPHSPTFEEMKELLGDLVTNISPALYEQEAKMDELFDAFHWPIEYKEAMTRMARYVSAHPDLYQQWLAWSEKLAALGSAPEDAPEVELLLAEYSRDESLHAFEQQVLALSAEVPQLEEQFGHVLSDLVADVLSPAQQRFFAEMARRREQ